MQLHLRRITILGTAAALLAGVLVAQPAPSAQALPGECQPHIVGWKSSGADRWTDADGNEHIVERGIEPIFDHGLASSCDVIYNPRDVSGASVPGPPAPPAPPGPLVPPPPPSVPPGAAPKCVAGSNNDPNPGSKPNGATGNGDIVIENVGTGRSTGDLQLHGPGPSRIISMDVNLGEPESGVPGTNPFEGLSPEDAVQALMWDGTQGPVSEVGGILKTGRYIAQLALHAAHGNMPARGKFLLRVKDVDASTRAQVVNELLAVIANTERYYAAGYKTMPPAVKEMIDILLELIDLAVEFPGPILGAPPADLAPLYASESTAGADSAAPAGTVKSACGQVLKAEVSAKASIAPGADWVTITLTGTEHGTLIDRLKAQAGEAPALYCPPTEIVAIAGQTLADNVLEGCDGTVTAARLMTRDQVDALDAGAMNRMLPLAEESMIDDVAAWGALDSFADGDSTSWLAEGSTDFVTHGTVGDLTYRAPARAGGLTDALVVAATDAAGVEHPFLVKVAVKAPPTCIDDGPVNRLDPEGEHGILHGGVLELNRGVPFVIDLKILCGTDHRDTYRVDLQGAIPGTTRSVDADGNFAYTWKDDSTAPGRISTLRLMAWDEVTGAPSTPIDIPVIVRDREPVCEDMSLEYDRSELAGAPLEITLDCALPDGLVVANPLVARLAGSTDGTELTLPQGVFQVDGSSLMFTPAGGAKGTAVARDAVAWTSEPGGPLRPRASRPFDLTVVIVE
jgi:hypothetical protein